MAKATLWINQLPFTATSDDIAKHFAKAARVPAAELVDHVRLVIKDGKFKGTAFVDVNGWDAVDRGVALHQSRFQSGDGTTRRINVREAVSKTQLETIAERSKANRGKVLAKAYGGKTKAAPKVYSDDESEAEEEAEEEEASGSEDDEGEADEEEVRWAGSRT